jgi:hypothetical protein
MIRRVKGVGMGELLAKRSLILIMSICSLYHIFYVGISDIACNEFTKRSRRLIGDRVMQSFVREVLETVERRLKALNVGSKPLTASELLGRFGRQEFSSSAFHFEVEVDGVPCALTVTVLDEQQADDYGPVRIVSEEVGRLQALGRFVAFHQVMVAPRGTILLDLVGPERTASKIPLDEAAERFLMGLLDHDTVRPLLK